MTGISSFLKALAAVAAMTAVLSACSGESPQETKKKTDETVCWKVYESDGAGGETVTYVRYKAKDMDYIYGTINEMDGRETYRWEVADSADDCQE